MIIIIIQPSTAYIETVNSSSESALIDQMSSEIITSAKNATAAWQRKIYTPCNA